MGWPWQRKEKHAESEPVLEPLSDRQYEQLFLALLKDVEAIAQNQFALVTALVQHNSVAAVINTSETQLKAVVRVHSLVVR